MNVLFDGSISLQNVERDPTKRGRNFRICGAAYASRVRGGNCIKNKMLRVFNAPVTANMTGQSSYFRGETGYEK